MLALKTFLEEKSIMLIHIGPNKLEPKKCFNMNDQALPDLLRISHDYCYAMNEQNYFREQCGFVSKNE